ncbi:hypothetical protein [Pseudonocardia broussonetiae]|uniref:Uncharacterized protein n=1 Tax=Pseudonocardia broussonetiae TaxID=2736640 RepID=A0A6M6JPZ2_9PSEU|nr:hypothetical protein [Pseudonocardia broussonetiae]QJY49293.1 hypothetical protein HOP40_28995 [Pseudonocardia broussonetiae]
MPAMGDRAPDAVTGADCAQEFDEWLGRVGALFEAVRFTCTHRLADPTLAEQVSVQVVAGMVARPAVFRYFGLPFSGRIAKLAEGLIATADAGGLAVVCGWPELRDRIADLPQEHREPFVVTCLRGGDVEELAAVLSCDVALAEGRHEAMLAHVEELVRPGTAPVRVERG